MAPKKAETQEELPKQIRLDRAISEYHHALSAFEDSADPLKKKPVIESIAKSWGVVPTTLSRRIAGKTRSAQVAQESYQRLSPLEEQALRTWILKMAEWGWPATVRHVRQMVVEMLKNKGDHEALGKNWIDLFLNRHKDLQSRFSQPLDKARVATHDTAKILQWFKLVKDVIQKYDIQMEDTYNMDEKGIALGIAGKERVLCSKHQLQAYKAQDSNREWISLIDCISADARLLSLFIIFKAKRRMKAWDDALEDKEGYIAISENGWTNNVIGLEWFTKYVRVTHLLI